MRGPASIDYAKAFNHLSYQECLVAMAKKGASSEVISLVSTFLTNRTMTVRVQESWSDPFPVHGGVPQGSILGVILFNLTTEDLEENLDIDTLGPPDAQLTRLSDPKITSTKEHKNIFIHLAVKTRCNYSVIKHHIKTYTLQSLQAIRRKR